MQFQRVSPVQVLVLAPPEAVREAAWYALWSGGIWLPTIDIEKNVVSGSQGDGVLTVVRVASAHLEPRPEGTLVRFESKPAVSGVLDFGATGRGKKLADSLERVLASGYEPTPQMAQPAPEAPSGYAAPAPIADPSGAGFAGPAPVMTARPLYGTVLAPKQGVTILSYGLISLILCQILSPVTLIYGYMALNDYKRRGDPGDKGLVITGMVIAVLGLVVGLFLLLSIIG